MIKLAMIGVGILGLLFSSTDTGAIMSTIWLVGGIVSALQEVR